MILYIVSNKAIDFHIINICGIPFLRECTQKSDDVRNVTPPPNPEVWLVISLASTINFCQSHKTPKCNISEKVSQWQTKMICQNCNKEVSKQNMKHEDDPSYAGWHFWSMNDVFPRKILWYMIFFVIVLLFFSIFLKPLFLRLRNHISF